VSGPRTAAIFSTLAERATKPTQEASSEGSDSLADSTADEVPYRQQWCAVALEAEILESLHAGPLPNQRISGAFERKERELAAIFARLSITDARSLHRRLTIPAASDPLAQKFGQMVIDRQQRLITFLAGARRREALRQSDVKR
jgi:hypothetical protein